jgi:hypothetical protein
VWRSAVRGALSQSQECACRWIGAYHATAAVDLEDALGDRVEQDGDLDTFPRDASLALRHVCGQMLDRAHDAAQLGDREARCIGFVTAGPGEYRLTQQPERLRIGPAGDDRHTEQNHAERQQRRDYGSLDIGRRCCIESAVAQRPAHHLEDDDAAERECGGRHDREQPNRAKRPAVHSSSRIRKR